MSIFNEDLGLHISEESEDDDDEEQRNREIDNKLAGFDDTLGSSDDEEGDGDQVLDDGQVNHSTEGSFAPNENSVMDYPQAWPHGQPFIRHEMQTSTPYDNRQVPPLQTPHTAFVNQHYEDPHADEGTCVNPHTLPLQTPSTAFARNYRNPDGNPYANYAPLGQTSSTGFAPELYQDQQDIEVPYGDGHDADYDTMTNFNNSASQLGFNMQPAYDADRVDYQKDQAVDLQDQHHSNELSDVYNGNDVLVDDNRRFYNKVGSTAGGEIERLNYVIEMQKRQIGELMESVKKCQEKQMAEARKSSYIVKSFEAEKSELTTDLQKMQTEVNRREGELQRLDYEVKSLRAEKDELLQKYREAEQHMAMMKSEIESFKSANTLALMKQQYEDAFSQLREKYESEVSKLKGELGSFKASNQEKEERIKELVNDKEDCTRKYEKDKLERVDTINKLTKALNESQDQCQQMLLKGGNAMRSFGYPSLDEMQLKQQESEGLNRTLKEENENLKLHLAAKEEMLLNDLVNEISQKRAQLMAADDSYAQLNIKRPSIDMEELERFFSSKVTSIEKLMSLLATAKSHNATLREDLRKAQDEQKKMVKEFESAKNSLKEIKCDGLCMSASALSREVQNLKAEIKKLSSSKKKVESELDKKDKLIHQLEENIADYKTRMSQLVADFNEDKRKALDSLEIGWAERFQNALEAHELEVCGSLHAELDSSRKQLLEMEVQLSRVQQDYLECCEERKKFEKELNLAWEKKMGEMKQVHMIQLSSLKEICSINQRKCPQTIPKDSSVQVGVDVASKCVQVGDDVSMTTGLKEAVINLQTNLLLEKEKNSNSENLKLQLESNLRERECKINELKQLLNKTGKDLDSMRNACLNLEKQSQLQATKMKQIAEEELLTIVRDLVKKKGKPCEVSFNETWTWVQKIEHLLSAFPETKTEVFINEHESFERYLDLKKKIEEYEKESILYLGQNIDLNNKNSKLSEELNQASVEIKKLRKITSENEQDIAKLKQALEKYRCERRSLYADTKKLETKIQEMEKSSNETRLKLESEKDDKIKSLLESESFLQNNLQEALEKLSNTRKSLEELDERSKKRLNEMMKSMDREKEEAIQQLKKCFKIQLTQKEKEKKILDELLKDSEHRSHKEIRSLKKKLEEVVDEKIALEKCDLGDQMKKYKGNVEEARLYYSERVRALEVEKKKYKRAQDKVSSTVKQCYIRHMRDFLRGRFDSSSAVEIMAHVEVYLDGIPSLIPNEEMPPSDLSQLSHRDCDVTNQSLPASPTSSLTSQPSLHPLTYRPSTQASDAASSYRLYARGMRNP